MAYGPSILYIGLAIGLVIGLVLCVYGFQRFKQVAACRVLRTIPTPHGVVEIMNDTCKEGLPHTTDAHTIRMPRGIWEGAHSDEVMVHERVHLAQKQDPAQWAEFYRLYWDYELLTLPPPSLPAMYVAALRPNPDTAAAPWALWRKRYLFFPNYADPARATLRNVTVCVWDLQDKRRVDPPPEWKAFFCSGERCPNQWEHPHELSAELITRAHTQKGMAAATAAAEPTAAYSLRTFYT